MWIVALALKRPYTFLVLAIVILLLGVFTILRTPTDIFPNIRIPVVATVWNYTGLSPEEMATRLVLFSERVAQTHRPPAEPRRAPRKLRRAAGSPRLIAHQPRGGQDVRRLLDQGRHSER